MVVDELGREHPIYECEPVQCQFCWENQSSIANGGTVGVLDSEGLITHMTQQDLDPIVVDFSTTTMTSFTSLKSMHGKRIAIFKQKKGFLDKLNKTKKMIYEYETQGRCLGRYIFTARGKKIKVDLDTFLCLYFPAFDPPEGDTYTLNLNMSVS